jgi:hypothetical protein
MLGLTFQQAAAAARDAWSHAMAEAPNYTSTNPGNSKTHNQNQALLENNPSSAVLLCLQRASWVLLVCCLGSAAP